ncbi:MAG: hypothetical protein O3A14_21150, partial [Cyanobacteria bacterium]|nr:hypothetical protein [Cyanobacteriota bacterium]
MGAFRRFLSISLASLFSTLLLSGGLTLGRLGQAIASQGIGASPSGPGSMGQMPTLANGINLEPPESSASTPTETGAETLTLPDFEPRLPAASLDPQDRMADSIDPESLLPVAPAEVPKLSRRQQLLIAADQYYLAGAYPEAENIYRQVKNDLWLADALPSRPVPIFDAADLPPGGAVYWREANQGLELGLAHRTRVPLQLLTETYPEFIPGQVRYARYLMEQGELEEANGALDQALLLYPSQPDLLKIRVEVQMALEQWI